jgi:hypothetical protein
MSSAIDTYRLATDVKVDRDQAHKRWVMEFTDETTEDVSACVLSNVRMESDMFDPKHRCNTPVHGWVTGDVANISDIPHKAKQRRLWWNSDGWFELRDAGTLVRRAAFIILKEDGSAWVVDPR